MITSIVIPTYNKLNYTIECIESIRKYTQGETYEIIIVDNCSTDGTREWLQKQEDIKHLLNEKNQGFPKACNQGIENAIGDNILLLNNDVVVTNKWLENLLDALYSSPNIGAVGPVTNSAAYYTSVPVNYNSIEGMQEYAFEYNISNAELWEERLKLIGFCMLIKKDVVNQIGLLDERFSPGNFEDDDYSIRIRLQGYKLLLCKDTFIHHYGSVSWRDNVSGYSELLSENEQKFMDKWGTNSYSYMIHNDLIKEIPFDKDKSLEILHIGCDAGGTLLKIKNIYKKSFLFGIEENKQAAKEASVFAEVLSNPFEVAINQFEGKKFDVIVITNWNKVSDLSAFINNIKKVLSNEGILLSTVNNATHISVINALILGKNLQMENRYMTLQDINKLFKKEARYKVNVKSVTNGITEEEKKIVDMYCSISEKEMKTQYETFRYLISAKKYNENLQNNIHNIYKEIDVEINLEELNQYSEDEIIDCIVNSLNEPIQILQSLAILNFSRSNHDNVLSYLSNAYELDPNNSDTLYNLGIILYSYHEKELAKHYLECLSEEDKDDEVEKILMDIKFEKEQKEQKLVYLLRRLEFDIEFEGSQKELVHFISEDLYSEEEIIDTILNNIIDKEKVLNTVSIISFENGLNDSIFPFLNKAYELNPQNDDTMFNLGYILSQFGEKISALSYLRKISVKDKEVLNIIDSIEEGLQ